MTLYKALKNEIALRIGRIHSTTVTRGISAGMRLHGSLFYNRRPEALYEEELLYKRLVVEGDIVMDVGAHVGIYTFFFSRAVGDGRVLAFEPNPINYNFLCRNIKRNGLYNVEALNVGLADKEGRLQFVSDRYNTAKGTFKADKQTLLKQKKSPIIEKNVPIVTIDGVVEARKLDRLDFVKIDTEGFEPCDRGNVETLQRLSPQLYFEVHGLTLQQRADDLQRIFHFLQVDGYRIFRAAGEYEEVLEAGRTKHGGGGYLACPEGKCDPVRSLRST